MLLDAAVVVCRAFAEAAAHGMDTGHDTATIFVDAFAALFRSARKVAEPLPLRGAVLRHVVNHPGRLAAILDEETPSPVQAASEVIAEGQRRGEIRTDQPAESLAVVLCYSVLFATRRGATIGRPPDSPPLSQLALDVVLHGMRPVDTTSVERSTVHGRPRAEKEQPESSGPLSGPTRRQRSRK
ncbi:MAG: hypothetical protein ACRDN0_06030 [Trebonia sp.]